MRIWDLVRRSAVAVRPDQTLIEGASIMDKAGVGALIVVDADRPVGIVTDRDLVRRGLARGLPPDARIDAVMTAPVVTVNADDDAHDVYQVLRTHALRRLPIVREGRFVGMVTVDDLIIHLAADLSDLARPITGEVLFAQRDGLPPATVG
ncbi:MAG TPA: CBS domain-containing protein [Acidimicrobiales bacterium]|nr:CBS domain-containing protein [Acidimicrobiales bacterium]